MATKSKKSVFKLGDMVKLKSGGPEMMINFVSAPDLMLNSPESVTCKWFAGKKLESGSFSPETLEFATTYSPQEADDVDDNE